MNYGGLVTTGDAKEINKHKARTTAEKKWQKREKKTSDIQLDNPDYPFIDRALLNIVNNASAV